MIFYSKKICQRRAQLFEKNVKPWLACSYYDLKDVKMEDSKNWKKSKIISSIGYFHMFFTVREF